MDEKKYYAIEHTMWGEDWEETEYFFFLTENEANEYADELRVTYKNSHRISINEISFEEMKELITAEEFEELFDITINEPRDRLQYNDCMSHKDLTDWYINSVSSDDTPVWTEEHIEELLNDFYVIPKDQ